MSRAPLHTRLRALREARGCSQTALCAEIGLSRQSLGAIEAGRSVPGVDVALRLARALGVTVETLFGPDIDAPELLEVEAVVPAWEGRAALAWIGGRWVASPLPRDAVRMRADGLARPGPKGRVRLEPLEPVESARDNLLLTGCVPGLGVLADRLNAARGPGRFLWVAASNAGANAALERGHTHVAVVHHARSAPEEAVPAKRRRRDAPLGVVLGNWELGLVTAPGNPLDFKQLGDLFRPGTRWITRDRGSGVRALIEKAQRREHRGRASNAAAFVAHGHLEVAQAVALGAVDVGVASRDAALSHGLGFVAITEERCELRFARILQNDLRLQRLIEALSARPVRRELEALGYDLREGGTPLPSS